MIIIDGRQYNKHLLSEINEVFVNGYKLLLRETAALARIAAVTPQQGWRVGERKGLALERIGRPGARSMSREPDQAPEKTRGREYYIKKI